MQVLINNVFDNVINNLSDSFIEKHIVSKLM